MKTTTFFTITGPSGSGKSTVATEICNSLKKKRVVSHTSREIRPGEMDGVSYHFVSNEEILQMKNDNKMVECTSYNGVFYGETKEEIDQSDIMVIDPIGLTKVKKYLNNNGRKIRTIYLNCEEDEAMRRMHDRGDDDFAIYKRVEFDRERFRNVINNPLSNYDIIITTDGFTCAEVADIVSIIVRSEFDMNP